MPTVLDPVSQRKAEQALGLSGAASLNNLVAEESSGGGGIGGEVNTVISTAGNGTLTAAGLVGGLITRTGPTGAFTDTTATVAQVVTAIGATATGTEKWEVKIKNLTAFAGTLSAGSGFTISGLSIVPPFAVWTGLVTLTSTTAGTIVGIGAAPLINLPETLDNTVSTGTGTMVSGAIEGAKFVTLTASGQAAITLTTRTAAQIQANVPNWQTGMTYRLRIVNTNSGTLTTAGGSNVTMTSTIPANHYADYTVTFATATTITTAQVTVSPISALNVVGGVAAGYKIARGVHTQAAASDTVVTGLATVVAAVANFAGVGPTVKQLFCHADIGDQAGTPAAGSILINTYKPTDNTNDVTPVAATDFSDNVTIAWVAIGT